MANTALGSVTFGNIHVQTVNYRIYGLGGLYSWSDSTASQVRSLLPGRSPTGNSPDICRVDSWQPPRQSRHLRRFSFLSSYMARRRGCQAVHMTFAGTMSGHKIFQNLLTLLELPEWNFLTLQ